MLLEEFRNWAINLGCPLDAVPNGEELQSIFKSRQRDLFCNLMKRIQPQKDVQVVRKNVLLKKMRKVTTRELLSIHSSCLLPKELQLLLKLENLRKQNFDIMSKIESIKREFETKAVSIKRKNIRAKGLEHTIGSLQAKVLMLNLKSESLSKDIIMEQEHQMRINATMPAKLSAKNASESAALDAVRSGLNDLDNFYDVCVQNSNPKLLQEAKDNLWEKMRSLYNSVPNFLLYSAILRCKNEQLQTVIELNDKNYNDAKSRGLCKSGATESPCTFEFKLLRTKVDLLGIVSNYICAQQERVKLEEQFSDAYSHFVNELENEVYMFHDGAHEEEESEEIISDFIVQYNLRNFSKSRNDYLQQQIANYKEDLEQGTKQLENHEVLIGSIKQVYSEINVSVNRIQYEVVQLSKIKERIQYSKLTMQNMFDQMHITPIMGNMPKGLQTTKLITLSGFDSIASNVSQVGSDSFELGSEHLLCSTQIDLDMTTSFAPNASRRNFVGNNMTLSTRQACEGSEVHHNLPSHLREIQIFNMLPTSELLYMPHRCPFYLCANPIVLASCELWTTIQLVPGNLLTPFGVLDEIKNRITWAADISAHVHDLQFDMEDIKSDPLVFKAKAKEQRENMVELKDKISVAIVNTDRTVQKMFKIYKFILDNILRQYIPSTKTFNNRVYCDYEAEFTIFYRMISDE